MERDFIALAVMIAGVILFFYNMNLWFYGSIIALISSNGFAYAIIASGEKEERIKQMEERIKKLEAEKEREKWGLFWFAEQLNALEIIETMQNNKTRVAKLAEIKKTLKEDWTVIPFLGLTLLGFAVAILDFAYLQNFSFQVVAIVGLFLLVAGSAIRMKARFELKRKAGFGSYTGTGRVKIVKDHQLVKDGLYEYIRNPIYLGEILRNLGFAVIFSSVYGSLIVLLASVFLLFRIELEEKMLVAVFGEEYEEYKRNTKRIIPYIY